MSSSDFARNDKLIQQKYREYLIPAVLTSATLALASTVDAAIVGNLLGAEELAGIGGCTPVIAIINALTMLFMIGGITCASVALGERKRDQANRFFTITILSEVIVSVLFVALMEPFADPITMLLANRDAELASMIMQYYRPILFVYPALVISLVPSQFMRLDGYPKMASYIMLVSNAINLILDYVFIKFFGMGLTGASLSTVLGYTLGASMVLIWVFSKNRSFRLTNPFKSNFFTELRAVLKGGSSECFMNISDFFKRILLNMIVLHYLGNAGLSVLTICNSLQFFARAILKGAGDAFLPIVGTLFGEKDYYGIRRCVNRALTFVAVAAAVLVTVMLVAPQFVGGLFGLKEGATAPIADLAIRLLAVSIPFMGVNLTLQTLYNTTGRARFSTTISILDGVVYVCIFAFLLPMIAPSMFWAAFSASEAMVLITAIVIGLYIRKKEKAKGYLLLNPLSDDILLLSYTAPAGSEAAAALSQKIQSDGVEAGIQNNLANRIAVAVEEMTVAVYNGSIGQKKQPIIDVTLEQNQEETVLSFRENGKPANPIIEDPEHPREQGDGIDVLKRIAKSVDYSRQLGFNTVVVKFERSSL